MYLITVATIVHVDNYIDLIDEKVFSYELFKYEDKVKEVVNELNIKYIDKFFSYIQCTINDTYD